ncbi:primase-helicase family protein [Paraburkholderia sp. B3]|uniref:primase-helicase family protein n=1 Tax=Paraburkholderia sp. B3 TaxID=3134791 RepID=UPI003982BE24
MLTIGETQYATKHVAKDALAAQFVERFKTVSELDANTSEIMSGAAEGEARWALDAAVKQARSVIEQGAATDIIAKRQQQEQAAGAYSGVNRIESLPEDWYWMAGMGQTTAVYFHKDNPFRAYKAQIMDERIPKRHWEKERDGRGVVVMKSNKPVLVPPSRSHLSCEDFEIHNLTMDPYRSRVYTNDNGERCLNQYKELVLPPSPGAEYLKIGEVVEKWLEFIYPGRAAHILDWMAHAYQQPLVKPKTCIVFGGGQGIGKGAIIDFFKYTFARQDKVSSINTGTACGPFNEFLLKPIVFIDEFHVERSDKNYMEIKNNLKSWIAGDRSLSVNAKNRNLAQVANIHRILIATNYEQQIPRDPDDRRFFICSSHVTKEQVKEYMRGVFADVLGRDFDTVEFEELRKEGYGDGFTHFLLERDISKFDPHNLPAALMAEYDEYRKGHEMPHALESALSEITVTFGRWRWMKERGMDLMGFMPDFDPTADRDWPQHVEFNDEKYPCDPSVVSRADWPAIVAGQQILNTQASYDDDGEGERIHVSKRKNGYMERLMSNAGYQKLMPPDGKAQWVGKAPKIADQSKGAIRVQTALYYLPERFGNDLTMKEKRALGEKFVRELEAWWCSTEGVSAIGVAPKKF